MDGHSWRIVQLRIFSVDRIFSYRKIGLQRYGTVTMLTGIAGGFPERAHVTY
jgi:hypothetical protein